MPIDPITIGAGISGLSNLASNLIGNSGSRKSQQRANQYNVDFWNMQNKYNHPVEQMARLKDAGLNPNLIYGTSPSSAVGNADKIAPAKAEPYNFDNPLNELNLFQNVKSKKLQNNNLEGQNDVLVQEALLKSAQTSKTLFEGAKTKVDYDVAKELKQTSIDIQREALRKMEQQTIGHQIDNVVKDRNQSELIKQAVWSTKLIKSQLHGQQKTNELRKLEIDLKRQGLENSNPFTRFLFRRLFDPNGEINFDELIPLPIRK